MADINNISKKEFERKLANISPCLPTEDVYSDQSGAFVSLNLHEAHDFTWDVECLEDPPYEEV